MMNTNMTRIKYLAVLLAFSLTFFGTSLCSAQNLSELIQSVQGMSQDEQNQLINQIAGQVSSTGTSTGTTTSGTTSTTGTSTTNSFPLGKKAINYVLGNNPGKAVRAAADGTPIFQGQMFEQPVDEPDFWEQVKAIFLDGLAQAITNVTGIPVFTTSGTFTSPVSTAGQ